MLRVFNDVWARIVLDASAMPGPTFAVWLLATTLAVVSTVWWLALPSRFESRPSVIASVVMTTLAAAPGLAFFFEYVTRAARP